MMPAALLLGAGTLIAVLYALGKAATAAGAGPAAILLWQVAGGAAGLAAAARLRGEPLPSASRRHLRYYAVSGLLGVTLPNALVYWALQSLDVAVVTLLTALSALLTYGGALLLGLERFSGVRLAGCVLGLAGVAVLCSPAAEPRPALALAAALGAPLLLAAGNLYRSRAWPAGAAATTLATGMLWVQLPLVAIAAAGSGAVAPPAALPALAAIASVAPVAHAAHFALQRVGGPVYVSQLGYVMAVAGGLLGHAFFGERPGAALVLAAALIACGVAGVAFGGRGATAPRRSRPAWLVGS